MNVDEVFHEVVREIRARRVALMKKKKRRLAVCELM